MIAFGRRLGIGVIKSPGGLMSTTAGNPEAPQPRSGDLQPALRRAHAEAITLLADPGGSRLDVVSWLSAHLAAFEHVVYRVAKHRLSDGRALLDEDRRVSSQLSHVLRITERVHSGDVLATNLSAQGLRERLTDLVTKHSEIQERIVAALDRVLDPAESASLAKDYADALVHAPTRPHPHMHSRVLFRLDAMRDKILDTMDGRHVPIPKIPRTHITPGRWGSYLLGQPQPADDDASGEV